MDAGAGPSVGPRPTYSRGFRPEWTDNGRHWDSLLGARVIIEDWRIDYSINRPHTAHCDLSPAEFAAEWTTINQPQAA